MAEAFNQSLVPPVFRRTSSKLATYNFYDIASGTGYITFYGSIDQSTNGILSSKVTYSDAVSTTASAAGADALRIDKDFDVVITRPLTLQGIMITNFALDLGVLNPTTTGYGIIKLRKWDGSTETEIASATSRTLSNNGAYNGEPIFAVRFSVPTTVFKVGETLRVTVLVYGAGQASATVVLYHDPENRDATAARESSQLTFHIPVRIT